ncbi:MAG: MFS transporter [Saccharolobus sp.]|nr:MFS transporter [Saccharolobus sp.]
MEIKSKFLILGLIIMLFNSIYQYSWNSIAPLLLRTLNVNLTEVELAFTLYVIFSSFSQIVGGYIIDTLGPKLIGVFCSILFSLGFLVPVFVRNILVFYAFWSVGSIAEGILYGVAVNLAIKWYEKRRGFATGLISLGFGIGGAIFNPFISLFKYYFFPFTIIGFLSLIILLIISLNISYPPKDVLKGQNPVTVIKRRDWWVLYFSYVLAIIPLLSFSSSLSFLGSKLPKWELLLAITLFPIMSGVGRPLFGMISDRLNRFNSIILLNTLSLISSILSLISLPISAILVGLFGGSTLTLYLSFVGDLYGTRFSGTNSGMLYTAKAVAGVLSSTLLGFLILKNIKLAILFIIISPVISILLLTIIKFRYMSN